MLYTVASRDKQRGSIGANRAYVRSVAVRCGMSYDTKDRQGFISVRFIYHKLLELAKRLAYVRSIAVRCVLTGMSYATKERQGFILGQWYNSRHYMPQSSRISKKTRLVLKSYAR